MKKHILLIVFCIVVLFTFPLVAYAHPGGTDEDGGHFDKSTGEYHYHHGEPAHQHQGGECEYEVDRYEVNEYDKPNRLLGSILGVAILIGISFLFFRFLHLIKQKRRFSKKNIPKIIQEIREPVPYVCSIAQDIHDEVFKRSYTFAENLKLSEHKTFNILCLHYSAIIFYSILLQSNKPANHVLIGHIFLAFKNSTHKSFACYDETRIYKALEYIMSAFSANFKHNNMLASLEVATAILKHSDSSDNSTDNHELAHSFDRMFNYYLDKYNL